MLIARYCLTTHETALLLHCVCATRYSSTSDANQAAVVMAVGLFPLSLLGLLMGLVVVSTIDWHTGAVPFTAHEWILATQGGYLHTMIDHYIRNGGL